MKFLRLGTTVMLTSHIRALMLGGVHLQGGLARSLTSAATAATSHGRWGARVLVPSSHAYSSSQLQCAPKDDFSKRPRPKDIHIPMDKVNFKYARSSGPGGQNVNKVNSKAEIRFHVQSANWLPPEVRGRLSDYQANRINNDGELIAVSQEFRTQSANKESCIGKLQEMIADAYLEPKERKLWEGIGDKGKKIRREAKTRRSDVKASRRAGKNFSKGDW